MSDYSAYISTGVDDHTFSFRVTSVVVVSISGTLSNRELPEWTLTAVHLNIFVILKLVGKIVLIAAVRVQFCFRSSSEERGSMSVSLWLAFFVHESSTGYHLLLYQGSKGHSLRSVIDISWQKQYPVTGGQIAALYIRKTP